MPNYGIPQSGGQLTSLIPGDGPFYLFNAETPTAPQASVAFSRGAAPGTESPSGIVFTVHCATPTPTVQVDIQGCNVDVDAQYQSVGSVVNLQDGFYADIGNFRFYRAKLISGNGGALTVIAQR